MGCANSKITTNNSVRRTDTGFKLPPPVEKFVPGDYDYVGLSSNEVNELKNTDRSAEEYSIRDLKTWANVVYIYDGDTCHIVIKYHGDEIKLKCRVYGIDTPEMRGGSAAETAHAIRAKERFEELVSGRLVWVHILNNDDKYGRYLVKFYLDHLEQYSIEQIMIDERYGYEYYGGTRKKFEDWCYL